MGWAIETTKLMETLARRLERADLDGWQVRGLKEHSEQLYLIFGDVDSQRRVETARVQVHIYVRREQDGQVWSGESSWDAYPGDDLEAALAQALARAAWVANPWFTLPGPEQRYQSLALADETWREQPQKVLWEVRTDLEQALAGSAQLCLASAEVLAESREISFRNHQGLTGEYQETEVQVHFALLAREGTEETESLGCRRARFYQDLDIAETVQRYGRYAREGRRAALPPSGRFPVVFGEEALDTLFRYFTAQAGGPARFQGWSRFCEGEPVIPDPRGDRLTLRSDPWLPGGLETRPFDAHGLALRPVTVIEDNVFQQVLADKRYADYLQLPATGDLTNIRVSPGATPLAAMLRSGPVLHLLRFSTLEPNPVTGAISGEIRTGYLYDRGQCTPVKGGSVSGRLDEAFRQATFSSDTVQREAYYGPAGVRLEPMSVAGA